MVELEFEATVVFSATCDVFAPAGGPFADFNDVVNCCTVVLEALEVAVTDPV